MDILDLKIAEEIAPHFDNNLNSYSRAALVDLFKSVLRTKSEIEERQLIINGMISNLKQIREISIYRTEIDEVYNFHKHFHTENASYSYSSRLFEAVIAKRRKQIMKGKCLQLTALFHKIHIGYFKYLEIRNFPPEFRRQIRSILNVLEQFTDLCDNEGIYSESVANNNYLKVLKICYQTSKDGTALIFWSAYFQFDAILSIAKTTVRQSYVFPNFIERGIEAEEFFHPLTKNAIKNSLSIKDTNVIVLSGPNMSGKSTMLRSISVCVYLAHIGISVPARKFNLCFFKDFFIHMNSRDSLAAGLSHFMTEIKGLKTVVESAISKKHTFAVLDEIFSGTNVDDASELFEMTVRGLQRFEGSLFILSTHLNYADRINKLDSGRLSTYYLDSEVNDGVPVFHFTLRSGWSTYRFGMLLFKQIGLDNLLT